MGRGSDIAGKLSAPLSLAVVLAGCGGAGGTIGKDAGGAGRGADAAVEAAVDVSVQADGRPPRADGGRDASRPVDAREERGHEAGPVTIATGQSPVDLAVDEIDVYWINSGPAAKGGEVLDCPVAGCPGNVTTELASNGLRGLVAREASAFYVSAFTSSNAIDECAASGCGLAPTTYYGAAGGISMLIADGKNAYFSTGASIYQCPLGATCSAPTLLYTVPGCCVPGLLAVSSTEVFFYYDTIDVGPSSLRAVPIGGGKVREVCQNGADLASVTALIQAGGYLYFIGDYTGSIYQCPVSGGSVEVYAAALFPGGLAADGTNLYWTESSTAGSVMACPLGAKCSAPTSVASGQNYPGLVAVDSTRVFWATPTEILSVMK